MTNYLVRSKPVGHDVTPFIFLRMLLTLLNFLSLLDLETDDRRPIYVKPPKPSFREFLLSSAQDLYCFVYLHDNDAIFGSIYGAAMPRDIGTKAALLKNDSLFRRRGNVRVPLLTRSII